MTLSKIKTGSAVVAIVVALGMITTIVTNDIAAQTKPKVRADELLTQPGSVEGVEIRGRSTYSIFSTNGTVTGGDTNDFSVTVEKCLWRMTLDHPSFSHPPTQVGDDGTNYIVFAPGSAGTSMIEGRLTRYEDTATIYKSGSMYPRFHGLAVWLAFASKCVMPAPAGDIGNVLNSDSEVKLAYERQDDPEKNAFGPSMVRIFAKVRVDDVRTNRLVAEVEVMETEPNFES
jgi:hypothetical protein